MTVDSQNPRSRFRIDVRAMLVAVAAFAAIFWAVLSINERDSVRTWARQFARGDASERAAAAVELGQVIQTSRDFQAAVKTLLDGFNDSSPDVRSVAIRTVGQIVAKALDSQIPSVDPQSPGQADLLSRAATALVLKLNDSDENVRIASIQALISARSLFPQGPPAELLAALEDRTPGIRLQAIAAVGRFGSGPGLDSALPALFANLLSAEPGVAEIASLTLSMIKPSAGTIPDLAERLESPERLVRYRAASMLANLGPAAASSIPALIRLYQNELKTAPPALVQDRFLSAADPACEAARALGLVSKNLDANTEVIAALVQGLSSPNHERHGAAALALGSMGRRAISVIPRLLDDLKTAMKPNKFGGMVAEALGRIAPRSSSETVVIAALIEATRSEAAGTRSGAALALGEFGARAEKAIPAIEALKDDKSESVRWNVSASLSRIRDALPSAKSPNTATPPIRQTGLPHVS